MKSIVYLLSVAACLLLSPFLSGQKKQLTEDHYFKNNFKDITRPLPVITRWIDNSHFILMRNTKAFLVDAASGKETEYKFPNETEKPAVVQPAPFIKDNDLYIKLEGVETRLTSTPAPELNPTLSPDGSFIAFTRNNDLYTISLSTKKETRLTTDGSNVILNGYSSWVYMEEILGRASKYKAFWWSPDSKSLAFFRSDDSEVPVFTITDAGDQHGYVETLRYPKVGDKNPKVKIGIVNRSGGNVTWADFNENTDQYFGLPLWKPDGKLLVQWLNRKQDSLKIWQIDPANGNKTDFYEETQKTWVTLEGDDKIHFLKNGKGLIMQSDASGWNHLYYHDMNGKRLNAITEGEMIITKLHGIDEKKGTVYFSAREKENSTQTHAYKINLNGKKLQKLTTANANHFNVSFSPDYSYFVTSYNSVSTPGKIELVSSKNKITPLGEMAAEQFDDYDLAKTEIIRIKSEDGKYDLPMRIIWPMNMDRSKKYPVLISIYGGPERSGVMDTWTLNGNQQWYAKEGLIQVVMDHRGSGHSGKAGADELYHNLGYWEMKDYSSQVKWLIENAQADPSKICITGFSYGGYLSAYALTYGADVFTHGMAGGSVTDWSLYDTHYTERFMGTKTDNPEGYKNSNVLNHTSKYKGRLQIVHGMIDENVHMQNSILLISDLQDKKKDFEFMAYSGGRHGWGGNKGLHFQNLKTRFVYNYLLEKEVPPGLLK